MMDLFVQKGTVRAPSSPPTRDQDLRPAGAKYDEARQVTTYTQVGPGRCLGPTSQHPLTPPLLPAGDPAATVRGERGPECLAVGDPVRTTSPYVILGRCGDVLFSRVFRSHVR